MGVKERKEREKENLKQAILAAAEELFIKEGFENVSMRKIAEKIEYSATTIYLYYKDKKDLFHCLLEEYYSQLLRNLNSVHTEDGDLIASMKKCMRVYIEFGLSNPNFYKLAFMGNPEFKKEDCLVEEVISTEVFFSLRRAVEKCIIQGLFQEMDVELVTQVLWTMNHGITSLLIANPNFPWVDKELLINQSIDSAIHSFKA